MRTKTILTGLLQQKGYGHILTNQYIERLIGVVNNDSRLNGLQMTELAIFLDEVNNIFTTNNVPPKITDVTSHFIIGAWLNTCNGSSGSTKVTLVTD